MPTRQVPSPRLLGLGLVFGGALLGGCAGGTGDLKGSVTYQNKALRQGTVTVISQTGSAHSGMIQDDGTYTVVGVPIGPAKITVSSPDPRSLKIPQRMKDEKPPPPDLSRWTAIPDRYAAADQSGLVVEVKSGTVNYAIELK
jgi:hypothetical protein